MSDRNANHLALQDIASQIMPTLMDGLSVKQKKEKAMTKKKVKRKVESEQPKEGFEDFANRRTKEKADNKPEREGISFTAFMGQKSFSEQKFEEQQKQLDQKKAKTFRKRK